MYFVNRRNTKLTKIEHGFRKLKIDIFDIESQILALFKDPRYSQCTKTSF